MVGVGVWGESVNCAAEHGVAGLPRDHPLAEVIVML